MIQPQTCTACGQETRYGFRAKPMPLHDRDGWGWHHRELVDHNPVFGVPSVTPYRPTAAETEEAERPEPIPEPEMRSTPIDDADLSRGPRLVVSAAREAGWTVEATLSRGPSLHKTQWTSLGVRNSVLVRLSRGDRRAVAAWMTDGKDKFGFDFAWIWTAGEPSLTPVSSATLKKEIKA